MKGPVRRQPLYRAKVVAFSMLRRVARGAGDSIVRASVATEHERLATLLRANRVDLVVDVGANVGQYGRTLRDTGYQGRILSIEPLTREHARLVDIAASDPRWDVAPRAAIGDRDGEIEIHVAADSASSSILAAGETLLDTAPGTRPVSVDRVPLRTLDTVALGAVKQASRPFVKIDTQGYEDRVLRGAPQVLAHAVGLQVEVSLVPLYEGQVLYLELLQQLQQLGFDLHAVFPAFSDPRTGRVLQLDAVLFRDASVVSSGVA